MNKKRRKTGRGGQRRPKQAPLALDGVGSSNAARRKAGWAWVVSMVVGGGIVSFLLLRHYYPTAADPAGLDLVSNQSNAPGLSAAAAAAAALRGEEPDIPIAALKTEQLELGRRLLLDLPNSEVPIVLMGHIYEGHGNHDKAIEFWHKALLMNPNRADVCNSIATIEMGRGRHEEAITFWRKALDIASPVLSSTKLRSNIALALMVLGRQEEAIGELERELEINAPSGLGHFLLGKARLQQKDYNKAKGHFESALKLQPQDAGAHYGLITACRRLGQQAEAAEHAAVFKKLKAEELEAEKAFDETYDDALITRRRLAEVFVRAGEIYLVAGKTEKAEGLLIRAMRCSPGNTATMLKLASLYKTTDRLSEALALYKAITAIEPANAECKANISVLSVKVKQSADAEAAFSKAAAAAPTGSLAYRTLARFYLEKRMNLPRARALAEKAVMLDPMGANYIVLGWACDSQGDRKGALRATQRAAELEPFNLDYQRTYEHIKGKN